MYTAPTHVLNANEADEIGVAVAGSARVHDVVEDEDDDEEDDDQAHRNEELQKG